MDARVAATGLGFLEGPVVRGDAVICTSIDHGCLYEVRDGTSTVIAVTGGGPNGLARTGNGALAVAQNGGRRPAHRWPEICGGIQLVRDNLVHWLTRDPISPNDLCVGPDGWLYVTDPTRSDRRDDGRLWRCDTETGEAELLASVPWYPNGIAFGPEDDALYVASTGERRVIRFDLDGGRPGSAETFAVLPRGLPDGLAFDDAGNLLVAAVGDEGRAGEILTFDRDGRLIDAFQPSASRKVTNLALSDDRRLFVTDSDAGELLVFDWPHAALALHPFRTTPAAIA